MWLGHHNACMIRPELMPRLRNHCKLNGSSKRKYRLDTKLTHSLTDMCARTRTHKTQIFGLLLIHRGFTASVSCLSTIHQSLGVDNICGACTPMLTCFGPIGAKVTIAQSRRRAPIISLDRATSAIVLSVSGTTAKSSPFACAFLVCYGGGNAQSAFIACKQKETQLMRKTDTRYTCDFGP